MSLPELSAASYNGVEFAVPNVQRNTQHAIARWHAPYTSHVQKDDLGLASEQFHVQAFVCGAQAYAKADALRAELDRAEAGSLQLPGFTSQKVMVVSTQETQDYAERLCYVQFSLVFERLDETESLSDRTLSEEDPYTKLEISMGKSTVTELNPIDPKEEGMSLEQILAFFESLENEINNVFALMRMPLKEALKIKAILDKMLGLVPGLMGQITAMASLMGTVSLSFYSLPKQTAGAVKQQIAYAKQSAQQLERISKQNEPQRFLLTRIKLTKLAAGAAQNAANTQYQSAAEAQQVMSQITSLLEIVKHLAGYEMYEVLDDLQVFWAAQMIQIIRQLPLEQRIEITENEPLLALMWRLSGDTIGQIPNPFFPEEYEVRYVRS